jgi:hypothetical protein
MMGVAETEGRRLILICTFAALLFGLPTASLA